MGAYLGIEVEMKHSASAEWRSLEHMQLNLQKWSYVNEATQNSCYLSYTIDLE